MTNLGWTVRTVGLVGLALASGVGCQPKVVNAPASAPRAIREGEGGAPAVVLASEGEASRPVLSSNAGKAKVVVVDRAITPTLDKERQAQGEREAQALGQKVGVRFEKIMLLEKPAWYAAERAAVANGEGWMEYVGQGRSEKLREAYDVAVRLAKASATKRSPGAVGPTDVARAAYVRTETGEYVVWVLVRGK